MSPEVIPLRLENYKRFLLVKLRGNKITEIPKMSKGGRNSFIGVSGGGGGEAGVRDVCPLSRSNFFHFHAVFGKILAK